MTATELRDMVDKLLSDGYRLWNECGIRFPPVSECHVAADELAAVYDGPNAGELAAACQCFYFFRKLHGMVHDNPAWSTLMGDYFFSQFSKKLISLDNVPLTDAFSAYLKADIRAPGGVTEYISFIRGLPTLLR